MKLARPRALVRGAALTAAAGLALALLPAGAAHADTLTFSNMTTITIPGGGTAGPSDPYPSEIAVAGFTGPLTDVNVTLHGLSHTFPGDLAALVVAPSGAKTLLMVNCGDEFDVDDIDLVFDDADPDSLPEEAQITAGTYRPTDCFGESFDFGSPVPPGPYTAALSDFNGVSPNGTWQLYVADFGTEDVGNILRGWSLQITAPTPAPAPSPTPSPTLAVTCDGKAATETGTNGAEKIVGTEGNDVIVGLGGDDHIDGLGGDDLICAGDGDDLVHAGDGDDEVFGQQETDRLFGGDGEDELFGQSGRDKLFGQGDEDELRGGTGDDRLKGGREDDELSGNKGADKLSGGKGDDELSGGRGDDQTKGGPGNDS